MNQSPDYVTRISKLRSELLPGQALLVTDLINIRYLVGFTGSNGALLVAHDGVTLATDSRYEIQSAEQTSDITIVIDRDLAGVLLGSVGSPEIVVEGKHLSVADFEKLKNRFSKLSFTTSAGIVEGIRILKDAYEIEVLARAGDISTRALSEIHQIVSPGMTERDLAIKLEHRMRMLGADDRAFESIVAAGSNSAIPHHEPSAREIKTGDLLKIDFGAKVAGYHSDCTRTFVVGKAAAWQLELHEAVKVAQEIGRSELKSDTTFSTVVTKVVSSLSDSGYADYFSHGLGHGVGLAIHENPFFSDSNHAKIDRNTVITVEPGAYLPGKGGVRIEDTVVVTDSGYSNLTEFPYELISL